LIYFSFIGSLKYSFPPDVVASVRNATFGFFSGLKSGIVNGFRSFVEKLRNRGRRAVVEQAINNL
jgi:hypothetical protein